MDKKGNLHMSELKQYFAGIEKIRFFPFFEKKEYPDILVGFIDDKKNLQNDWYYVIKDVNQVFKKIENEEEIFYGKEIRKKRKKQSDFAEF
ncbi:MAG: hypothetical protein HPY53_08350 [Brevinematales bacterium]|nr:hypothetical protein [Brevinematales bacterium]